MTAASEKADVLAAIETAVYEPGFTWELPDDLESLWARRRFLMTYMTAARAAMAQVDAGISELLDGAQARLDDYLVRVKPRRTLRVLDPETFWDWLADDARVCFRPDAVRVTSLKAVAEKRGLKPQVIFDSLIAYEEGDDAVEIVPLTKAPKFAQSMEHGEIRDKGGRK